MRLKFGLIALVLSLMVLNSCSIFTDRKEENRSINSDSLEVLNELILKDSTDYRLYEKRATVYLQRGQLDPAFRDLSYAIDLSPKTASLYILLGDIYFLLGNTDNCFASLNKARELEPNDELPYLKLAETYLMIQNYDAASQSAEQAIQLNNNNSEGFYLKGIIMMETGDTLAALNNLKIACNLDTLNYRALMQVGGLLSVQRDTAAERFYHSALKAKPGDESALFLLALFYQENEKFEKAIEAYKVINEFYPQNQRAFYNLGYIYLVEVNQPEKAVTAFQQAIIIYPAYLEAIYNLGRTYEELGQYDLAREQYKQSLKLLPNYPLAVQGMNRLDDMNQ